VYLPEEGRFLKGTWSVLLILPAIFLFLCSPPSLWAFVPDDLGFVISGQEGSGRFSDNEESEKGSYLSSKKTMTIKKDNLCVKSLRLEKSFTNSIGMNFVLILAGSFVMGSPEGEQKGKIDEIQHAITLEKSFYMQETEVTFGQWKALMGDKLSKYNFRSDHPVEWVTWNECQEFIQKLNHREKTNKYRLPTEAEWEYACRAGTTTPFNTGNCLSSNQANYNGERRYKDCPIGSKASDTVPVKSFAPNAWGLYDMHGNVWEWCADLYIRHHRHTVIDLEAVSRGAFTVIRGGGSGSGAEECRSAYRSRTRPGYRYFYFGFRLIRDF